MKSRLKLTFFAGLFAALGCTAPAPAVDHSAPPATAAQPGCEEAGPTPANLPGATAHIYATRSGRDLRLHVFAPEAAAGANAASAHPAIVFFFGGGWRTGTPVVFADRARRMAAEGYVAIVPDYRVSCRDQTTAVDSAADAITAYQWVRDHAAGLQIDPSRIVLSGGSAGGHIAATAAMKAPEGQKPAALILFNPAVDLVAIAARINLTPEAAAAISPSVLEAWRTPPTLIVHGDADRTVPIETVRDFCQRLRANHTTCDLVEYPGKGHSFFQSRDFDPTLNASPYDDTLAQAIQFLKDLEIAP